MSKKLKQCPFCQSDCAMIFEGARNMVVCKNEQCVLSKSFRNGFITPRLMEDAWNRRVKSAREKRLIRALKQVADGELDTTGVNDLLSRIGEAEESVD